MGMGEDSYVLNFAKRWIISFVFFGMLPSVLSADSTLVCEGRLENKSGLNGAYFAPVNFKSLRIVPLEECGPETPCRYDFVVYSGDNGSVEISNVSIDSLCSSVFVDVRTKEILKAPDDLERSADDESVKVIVGPLLDLEEFDLKKITTNSIIFVSNLNEFSFHAIATEYLVSDTHMNAGRWHGDMGGGSSWEVYVNQEAVLTEVKNSK